MARGTPAGRSEVRVEARRTPLELAAAQPACAVGDLASNARAHAAAVRAAAARVVVFPELSLTGYDLAAAVVTPEEPALLPLREACAAAGSIALVGAPVGGDGGRAFIGVLRVDADGAEVVYRKAHLGGEEPERFAAGGGPGLIDVDGRSLGLGVCKDTGVAEHVAAVAALGLDAYLAGLVHLREELGEQERRGAAIARACGAYVAFASFAGNAGTGYERTAAGSTIWAPDGTVLARAGAEPGEIARATVP